VKFAANLDCRQTQNGGRWMRPPFCFAFGLDYFFFFAVFFAAFLAAFLVAILSILPID
jgi:hypothetical protein